MLVTCFGYTGYRNAKFGQIQVHERITETSRELLMQIKELAEDMGFEVLHGIVDCLWVVGEPYPSSRRLWRARRASSRRSDTYDWITFLPMSDGAGAYNRYFGRLNTGKMKIRGVMARKGRHPRVCQQNAAGGLQGPGRGKDPRGVAEDRAESPRCLHEVL